MSASLPSQIPASDTLWCALTNGHGHSYAFLLADTDAGKQELISRAQRNYLRRIFSRQVSLSDLLGERRP